MTDDFSVKTVVDFFYVENYFLTMRSPTFSSELQAEDSFCWSCQAIFCWGHSEWGFPKKPNESINRINLTMCLKDLLTNLNQCLLDTASSWPFFKNHQNYINLELEWCKIQYPKFCPTIEVEGFTSEHSHPGGDLHPGCVGEPKVYTLRESSEKRKPSIFRSFELLLVFRKAKNFWDRKFY